MNRRAIDKSFVVKAFKDKLPSSMPSTVWLSIDSRIIEQNDIFFAIKGEFADGHDHIFEAFEKGACLVVAEKIPDDLTHLPIILVKDSLEAFSSLAHDYLKSLKLLKIAITGSNGKTTTKEMVKACLSQFAPDEIYASEGNKNNHFGIPLSALEVKPSHKIAIFEMGMNHAEEIASHCKIVEPDMGIITNISFAHEGNFSDGILGVAKAKGELFEYLAKNDGLAIANMDDERVMSLVKKFGNKYIGFGRGENADLRILSNKSYSEEIGGQEVSVCTDKESFSFVVPLPGAHHAQNAAASLATVLALGQDVKKASLGLLSMKKTLGRMNISLNPKGFTMINDGYNANPASMKAGILASLELNGTRRVAVIGAMGELGEKSATHHFELGKLLAEHFDQLFICGKEALNTVKGAKEANFLESKIFYAPTSAELITPLKEYLTEGDLVFIKGSLSANMKAITDALSA